MEVIHKPLHLNPYHFRFLLETLGPSLGLWRGAEIAALREQAFPPPVLDLGCGDGLVTAMVLPQVEIGLDPDRRALEKANRMGIYRSFEVSTAEDAATPPGSVQTILSNSVLEHIPAVDSALAAAARLLKPGGRLVITSPSENFSRWLAVDSPRYARWRNQSLIHLNLWSLDEWQRRLKNAGLEVETARPYLRRELVRAWDALELAQMVWIGKKRLVGMAWKRLPDAWMEALARKAAELDLSAPDGGGGCLIVACKS